MNHFGQMMIYNNIYCTHNIKCDVFLSLYSIFCLLDAVNLKSVKVIFVL